jgi:hypothetical protein
VLSHAIQQVTSYRVMVRMALHTKDIGDAEPSTARRQLTHGVIQHGEQWLAPDRAGEPISYYGLESGIGLAIATMTQPERRIGVVGLGAGTIAAYGRPGDFIKFYEINALVPAIARKEFTYLSGSKAQIDIALGDARLVLEREAPQRFDIPPSMRFQAINPVTCSPGSSCTGAPESRGILASTSPPLSEHSACGQGHRRRAGTAAVHVEDDARA